MKGYFILEFFRFNKINYIWNLSCMKCNVFLGWSFDRLDRLFGKDCWLVLDKLDENLIFFGRVCIMIFFMVYGLNL